MLCSAATKDCLLTHGIRLNHRKTFLVINFLHLIRPKIIIKEFTFVTTPGETGPVPQAIGTGTSFARDEERIKGTIPMTMVARRPSTMNSLFSVDIPQNSMVGHQRQQISELQDKIQKPSDYFPSEAMLWIKELAMVESLDELKSSRSIAGKNFPNFEMLDAKIASALNKIIPNSHVKKKVSLEEQKAQKEDRFLRGRQTAFMINDYFRVTGAHDTVLDYADLFSVTLRDDNVQEFDTRWDEVLPSMSEVPSNDILESLYTLRLRESDQLKTVLELYDMEIR